MLALWSLVLVAGRLAAAAPGSVCSQLPYKALLPLSANVFAESYCDANPSVTSFTFQFSTYTCRLYHDADFASTPDSDFVYAKFTSGHCVVRGGMCLLATHGCGFGWLGRYERPSWFQCLDRFLS